MDDDSSFVRFYIEGNGKVGLVYGIVELEEDKMVLVLVLMRGILFCVVVEFFVFVYIVSLDLD